MDAITKIGKLIEAEALAIRSIPDHKKIVDAVDLIYEQVHLSSGKVVLSGMGKAGQIANTIATTLSSTGTPAVFLHPSEAQHGDLGMLQPNDVLFLLSNSGRTREILELRSLALTLVKNMPLILVTGHPETDLAKSCQVVLATGNPDEIGHLRLTPTTSTTVMSVIGDLVVVLLSEKIGFDRNQYALRHHSGYLGAKARADG